MTMLKIKSHFRYRPELLRILRALGPAHTERRIHSSDAAVLSMAAQRLDYLMSRRRNALTMPAAAATDDTRS
jgi:hypothetical protein